MSKPNMNTRFNFEPTRKIWPKIDPIIRMNTSKIDWLDEIESKWYLLFNEYTMQSSRSMFVRFGFVRALFWRKMERKKFRIQTSDYWMTIEKTMSQIGVVGGDWRTSKIWKNNSKSENDAKMTAKQCGYWVGHSNTIASTPLSFLFNSLHFLPFSIEPKSQITSALQLSLFFVNVLSWLM